MPRRSQLKVPSSARLQVDGQEPQSTACPAAPGCSLRGGAGRVVPLRLLGLGFHWRGRPLRLFLVHHVVDVVVVHPSSCSSGVREDTVVTLLAIGVALEGPGSPAVSTDMPCGTGGLQGTSQAKCPIPSRCRKRGRSEDDTLTEHQAHCPGGKLGSLRVIFQAYSV